MDCSETRRFCSSATRSCSLTFLRISWSLDFSSLTSLLRPFKEFLLYLLAAMTYWSSDDDDDPGSDFDRSIALGETCSEGNPEEKGEGENRADGGVREVGFRERTIFSSKCSIAMLEISRSSVKISCDFGSVLLDWMNLRTL